MIKIREKLNKAPVVCTVALLCCLLWGSAFPMIKIGYRLFSINADDTASIILFAGVRFFLAGLLTVVIFSIINKRPLLPKKQSVKPILILSLFQTVLQYIFFYLGLAHTTGVNASIINGTSVFIALLLTCLVFRQERLTLPKIIGTVLGFFGVFVAGFFASDSTKGFQIGDIFILFSSASYAFSSVFMKKYSKENNPAMLSGYQFMLGGLVMTAVGLAMGGSINVGSIKGIAVVIYLAFVSAVAYSLWSILLKFNDVSRIAVFGSFTPIFGFVLSYLLLGENTSALLYNLLGLLLVVAGMTIVNIKKSLN